MQPAAVWREGSVARMIQQGLQDLERLGRKLLLDSRLAELAGLQVDLEDSEGEQTGLAG